jgi:hypothetical protein
MATKSIFDIIRQARGDRDLSINWYKKKIADLSSRISAAKLMRSGKMFKTPQLRGLNFFRYDPKLKGVLPYYDIFPLVLPIDTAPGGFLGVNFHYLPIALRMKLFETLDNKRFRGNYKALKNATNIKPTIKHYLRSHLVSGFLRLEEDEFAPAIFMPVQNFKKANVRTVWADSRRMV